MNTAAPGRVESLDLIRGIAVLGILAINIAGFAGPPIAVMTPNLPLPGSMADEAAFAFTFVLFEGKMRALFALLFGASMVLFMDRAESRSRDGDLLQLRRLGWLMVFGLLHYFLFWWGDILFLYAAVGLIALMMRELDTRPLLATALIVFAGWHLTGAAMSIPEVRLEERVRTGEASAAETRRYTSYVRSVDAQAERDMREMRSGFLEHAAIKLRERPLWLAEMVYHHIGEILPLMLIGMVLARTGFFRGNWPKRRVWTVALSATGTGLTLTLAILAWVWPRGYPVSAMSAVLNYWAALPHLLMAIGYAALLVLATNWLKRTGLGRGLDAVGRMAFSNYLGATVVMTAIFYGWGLSLAGRFGHAELLLFVIAGWIAMLAWSYLWLARFRRGPLEWAWRSLTEWKTLKNRR